MIRLNDPLTVLPGIGSKTAEKFEKLQLSVVEDLLYYYPFRYEDFAAKSVLDLVDGEKAVVAGTVVTPPQVQYYGFKKNRLRFSIKQGELVIAVSFFNQPYLAKILALGQDILVWGKWEKKKAALTGMKVLAQQGEDLQPIYHLGHGISQTSLVQAITAAFEAGYHRLVEENLPVILRQRYQLLDRQSAIRTMHFPKDMKEYQQALRRIKFEELLYFQLHLQVLKQSRLHQSKGLALPYQPTAVAEKISQLPFVLTKAQERVLGEILEDLGDARHMNRLLQGDVGSGKTVIAGLAMYAAYTAGYQSALMVPTEILAEQHYASLQDLFPDLEIVLLTGSLKAGERRQVLEKIETGAAAMVIGTHALIQEEVAYFKLGLVVTDEQHRFGVNQRKLFREKGSHPDVLMMTATPIPRTLAITSFGDMEVSVIDQLPAGRKPIITKWVKKEQFPRVLAWLKTELNKGAQVYCISPLIEESEVLDLQNAVSLREELALELGAGVQVDLLHGKMKAEEKEIVMQWFKEGQTQVLVSTTVIEVGVNVPNATIMMIMDADRFGLSQLHQLRGRVGRGDKQSYAVLVANPKTESGKERMKIMTETTDGFILAEADLKMRGSGEIFGTRQSGLPNFQVANLVEDYPILEEARKVAVHIVHQENWQTDECWSVLVAQIREQEILD